MSELAIVSHSDSDAAPAIHYYWTRNKLQQIKLQSISK